MAKNKRYPYLAKKEYKGQIYVVLFSEENYGTIVMSSITDEPELAFGAIGDYDEDSFDVIPDGQLIFMTNGGIPKDIQINISSKED